MQRDGKRLTKLSLQSMYAQENIILDAFIVVALIKISSFPSGDSWQATFNI
jgi:hypothetical protein